MLYKVTIVKPAFGPEEDSETMEHGSYDEARADFLESIAGNDRRVLLQGVNGEWTRTLAQATVNYLAPDDPEADEGA